MSQLLHFFFMSSFLFAFVSGCAGPQKKNPPYHKINSAPAIKKRAYIPSDLRAVKEIPQWEEKRHLIAPGHLFSINHPSDEKIRGRYRVYFDGTLLLPYGVRIKVQGMDFATLKRKVHESYRKFFQRGAEEIDFKLEKREYWVEVRGFIKKSGYYLVKRKESIDRVIAKAGGLRGSIEKDFFVVSVKQQGTSYSVSLNQYFESNGLGSAFTWTGGDTVFINMLNQDAHTQLVPMVSVIGGVMSPGKVLFQENATLYYYLSKTGGVIPNLGYEESYVIRKVGDNIERINFDITDMNTVPDIQAGDVIMLNAEKRSLADKIWERAIQIGSLITSLAVLIIAL